MIVDTDDITWKSYEELTDDDFQAIEYYYKYDVDDNTLINTFYEMYYFIEEECTEGLRSMDYKFECNDLGFEDSIPTHEIYELEYVGDAVHDFNVGDLEITPYLEFEHATEYDVDFKQYLKFDIIDTGDNNSYLGTYTLEDLYTNGIGITENEYNSIEKNVNEIVNNLESEYKPFIDTVNKITENWEKILEMEGQGFRNYLEGFYAEYGFNEDGIFVGRKSL